ncbi:MAG: hypothetical protein M0Z85_03910 [Gammaproteobacteria bacterium]|nr:hypothetical protein [Gammaproteobacteria bacterium]
MAQANEDPMSLLPRAAFDGMMDVERLRIAAALRKRADWLRSEYLDGGNFEHLHAREQECRYLAAKIEEKRI